MEQKSRKKAIFVNVCILTFLNLVEIPSPKDLLSFVSVITLIAYYIAVVNVKHIFISRENRIGERKGELLYILIVLCYALVVAIAITGYPNKGIAAFVIMHIFRVVWLVLIAVYLNSIFRSARDERDSQEEHEE